MLQAPFVGREHELELYRDFLAKDTPWVLNITGMAGCGKSTLLAHFTTVTRKVLDNPPIALNFTNGALRVDPLNVLAETAAQVVDWCDPDAVTGFNRCLQDGRDRIATLETQLRELIHIDDDRANAQSEKTQRSLSEVDLSIIREEIRLQVREQVLEAFYEQMDTFRTSQLVLMLDACEWLIDPQLMEVGEWVLNELVPGLHARMRQKQWRCSAVLASRTPLKLKVIHSRDQLPLALPMLNEGGVDQYLEYFDMQDPDLRHCVYSITHGHPLSVSIISVLWQEREKKPFTLANLPELEESFNEQALLKFIQERLDSQLSSPFFELTHYGVLLRTFNLPLLQAVFPELLPASQAHTYFNQLIHYPYIESLGNYHYAFHDLLRAILAEHNREKEPDKWLLYHRRALDYFTQTAPHSPDWYYHALACNEEQAISDWLQYAQAAQIRGAREQLRALLQAAYDVTLKLTPLAQAKRAQQQGDFYYHNTQIEDALRSYQEALALYQHVGNPLGEANVLRAIGDVQLLQKEMKAALRSYQQARALYQEIGDMLGAANTLKSIGDIRQFRMEMEAALESYQQARSLYQALKDHLGVANVLRASGDVQQFRKDIEAAQASYEQALALYRQVSNRLGEANVLKAIGDLQIFHEKIEAAQVSYEQALSLYREIADRLGEANVLCSIGDIMRFREQPELALQRYEEALSLHKKVGNLLGEANALQAVGDVQELYDRPEDALQSYEHALFLFRQIGDQFGEANCELSMGHIVLAQERYEDALTLYTKAYQIYQRISDEFSQARLLYYRSFAYEEKHDQESAIHDTEAALTIAQRLNLPFIDLFRQRLDKLRGQ